MVPTFGRMATRIMMLQLFGTTRSKKWLLWGTFWLQLVVNGVTLILIFVQCDDVESLWDPVGHPSKCWSPRIQEVTCGPLLAIIETDCCCSVHWVCSRRYGLGFLELLSNEANVKFGQALTQALTLLPTTIFWKLRISFQLKLSLGFVLSLSGTYVLPLLESKHPAHRKSALS
jgi:hypothetical protein